ncbi:MAG TPA: phenylacetate-CoA oxygenase subunit PaaC [Panacibacter sp.]|nr:phenylacetate-CoA oxygenase subunit PaaC [Panacibacter sp.]
MDNTLVNYTLHLADSALILGHRNSEWCGHGPVLEQDIAITNISLDLIGQARNFYQYAAQLINQSTNQPANSATEDTLAYFRDAREFKNCLLTELPKGDWAVTVLRQFFFSQYQYLLYSKLQHSSNTQLAAIAEKALKEVTYHIRWSSEWVIRLGDSTEESHQRMLKAIDDLWMFTGELFKPAAYEKEAAELGFGVDVEALKSNWLQIIKTIFEEATLPIPDENAWMQTGGKTGRHTEHLGFILSDMQYLQKTYPGNEW